MRGIFAVAWPVVGMVHLEPLPGSPRYRSMAFALEAALADARALVEGGCDGLLVENFGDVPFHKDRVGPETVAAMTAIAAAIARERPGIPLGINVLRNDARAALGIAAAVGARFIRVNVHAGTRFTDQGVVEGRADRTLRRRRLLGAEGVAIWADVDCKHSLPVPGAALEREARDLAERALADALIVTGPATGEPPDLEDLRTVRAAAGVPVVAGSGLTAAAVGDVFPLCDGAIVGTAFKSQGRVDVARVRELLGEVRRARSRASSP